jgi:hypothetical protein
VFLSAALRRIRDRRHSVPAREQLFVGRWGVFGPELYLVGRRVRRLDGPPDHDGPAPDTVAFARQMLTEVMLCRPATQLARNFAGAALEPLHRDGFVLSKFDVEAWLALPHPESD